MKIKVIEQAMPNSEFSLLQNDEMNLVQGGDTSCTPYRKTVGCLIFHECGTAPNPSASEPAYTTDEQICQDYFSWTEGCALAGKCLLG
jgi:hypothetical protein